MPKRKKMSRHHRLPVSRGGKDEWRNISLVTQTKHDAYHNLFGNMNAQEVASYLTKYWIDPDYFLVAQRKTDPQPKGYIQLDIWGKNEAMRKSQAIIDGK